MGTRVRQVDRATMYGAGCRAEFQAPPAGAGGAPVPPGAPQRGCSGGCGGGAPPARPRGGPCPPVPEERRRVCRVPGRRGAHLLRRLPPGLPPGLPVPTTAAGPQVSPACPSPPRRPRPYPRGAAQRPAFRRVGLGPGTLLPTSLCGHTVLPDGPVGPLRVVRRKGGPRQRTALLPQSSHALRPRLREHPAPPQQGPTLDGSWGREHRCAELHPKVLGGREASEVCLLAPNPMAQWATPSTTGPHRLARSVGKSWVGEETPAQLLSDLEQVTSL